MRKKSNVVTVEPLKESAIGGGIEGAERTSRETFNWTPAIISPDRQINPTKDMADARSRDMVQNDGYAMGVQSTHRDSIVGSHYRLNSTPNAKVLGATDGWAEEFQELAEGRFNLIGDSDRCWFDASGVNTFTGLIRLGVGGFLMTGEILSTAEWMTAKERPFRSAVQMVAPSRLSNPDGRSDDMYLRRGVVKNRFGAPESYWIRKSFPNDYYSEGDNYTWVNVPARKPWGRQQVIHILEQLQPDQTRGISDMVSVLKEMRMTKKFKEIVLQNAVVNATYAAAIESELPKEMIFGSMGAGQSGFGDMLGTYLQQLQAYAGGSTNIAIDGVKMPHLFPGTKLSLKPMGTPGGVGTEFEESLLRHIAASLGLSYEQFSRDYTKTNYSSARASMGETWKFMQSRKKVVADRFAKAIYMLWLEEELVAGNLPLPKGKTVDDVFYNDPVLREAIGSCEWLGASRGQIDEMKETQAAVMRMSNNMSTLEIECGRLGLDWRQVSRQRARENRLLKELGLPVATGDATKPGQNDAQNTMREKPEQREEQDA